MTKKQEAAFKIVDVVCADYKGTRKEHVTLQGSLQVIYDALNQDMVTDKKKIKVPRKALPRDRKRKNKK